MILSPECVKVIKSVIFNKRYFYHVNSHKKFCRNFSERILVSAPEWNWAAATGLKVALISNSLTVRGLLAVGQVAVRTTGVRLST